MTNPTHTSLCAVGVHRPITQAEMRVKLGVEKVLNMNAQVLIATRSFGSTSPRPWQVLAEAGCLTVQADMSQKMSEERLIGLLTDVDAAIIGVVPMTARVLEHAPQLKVVCAHGVGVDHIDLEAASRRGVVVANCPGANDQAVADLAIGLMVAVARQIPLADRDVRGAKWGRYEGSELWKKMLGLIGLGRIGRAVARRALGFDMQVLAYDPYGDEGQAQALGVRLVTLEEVIASAEFLSLHAALTPETRHMIGKQQLEQMKPNAFLINTARGGLVDEAALYAALTGGKLAGAALDAFAVEPPVGSPLLELKNIIVTPHIGAHTREAIDRVGVLAAQNVVQALQTGEPIFRVV
jgi:D-3-phosphoglycerate dehydrogenase